MIKHEEDRVEWSINFTEVTKMEQHWKRVNQNDVYKKKLDTVYNKRQPRENWEKMNYREIDWVRQKINNSDICKK